MGGRRLEGEGTGGRQRERGIESIMYWYLNTILCGQTYCTYTCKIVDQDMLAIAILESKIMKGKSHSL